MDFLFKQQLSNVKFSGLDSGLDLDADKVKVDNMPTFQRQQEEEALKRALQNRPFDPNHMEFNVVEPVNTGPVDPGEIKFNFN